MQKNNQSAKYDICILGLGLSGMISALALANAGYKIVVIGKLSSKDKKFFADPRTTAITATSRSFFKSIGIWDKLQQELGPINDIYVVDNKSPKMIHFNSDYADETEPMGYLIENIKLKKILLELVNENININIIEETSYSNIFDSENNIVIELDTDKSIESEIVLICDGRHSVAKKKYFRKTYEKEYKQKAITFLVKHDKPHEGTAVEHFIPTGPFAILPLKEKNTSSIVWTLDENRADALLKLDKDEFIYLVRDNFGEFLGSVILAGEPAAFPLTATHVHCYTNGRMVLIADSAHTIHPLAGQGLNQGIKDISALREALSSKGITLKALSEYENNRYKDNATMLEITDTLNTVFSSNSKLLGTVRKVGFNAIEKIPAFKKILIKYAMGKR